jgi:hypothetical protein
MTGIQSPLPVVYPVTPGDRSNDRFAQVIDVASLGRFDDGFSARSCAVVTLAMGVIKAGELLADNEIHYELRTVQTIRGMEARSKAKWEADGWEFVSQASGLVRTTITFRRPKPKPQWRTIGIAGGVVVLAIVTLIVLNAIENGGPAHKAAVPITATTSPSVQPTQAPISTPTPPPPISSATDAVVVKTFRSYFAQRAASGVVLAKSVTDVSFSDGIVRVTFDPNAAGIDQATFDSINTFPNLAEFASTPIAFNDSVGDKLRPLIDSIETASPDGTSLGSFGRADILALNGLSK